MQISHKQLHYGWNEMKRQLFLTNNTESTLIFKIKTTELSLLSASPSRGFIQQKQTKSIQIVCNKAHVKFQAKLQIIYSNIDKKSQNFDQKWNRLERSNMQTNIILLARKQNLQIIKQQIFQSSNQKAQIKEEDSMSDKSLSDFSNSFPQSTIKNSNHVSFKDSKISKKDSVLSGHQKTINGQKMLQSVTSPLKNSSNSISNRGGGQKKQNKMLETKILQDQIRHNQNYQRRKQKDNKSSNVFQSSKQQSNVMPFSKIIPHQRQSLSANYFESMNPTQLGQLCFVQSQLLAERQQNQHLKQQIRKNKQLHESRNQMTRQYQINRSMTQQCNHEGVNLPILILIALIFFSLGVLISNF